jgi:predicted nucleotidyltransferase
MPDISPVLNELKTRLQALYSHRLKKLILYGSYTRNEATEGSDLDVLMVLDNFNDIWTEIRYSGKIVSELSLKHNLVISLIPLRERDFQYRNTPLLLNIRKEGILVA